MSIEAQGAGDGVISTRNGVPPESSDPPGGVPKVPDSDPRPHPAPTESEPAPAVDLPDNEPPPVPPRREAQHRSHHRHK